VIRARYHRIGDVVELADGALAIDARGRAPVAIVARDIRIAIAAARAEVTAHQGAIATVRVFAGSVEIDDRGRRVVVASGDLWTAPAEARDDQREASARAFRDGWAALRAGRDADAIAAFDRATDPAVAEDAAYWAAITSERTGDRADAARRLRDFIARFPTSPRIGAARAALDRVAP
jgi:TolA-binding protein